MRVGFNNISVPVWPVGLAIVIIFLMYQNRQGKSKPELLSSLIFFVYLLFAIDKVFFPVEINGTFARTMRQVPIMSHVNLKPFYFGQLYTHSNQAVLLSIKNILLTVPFGFGIIFVSKVRKKDFLWLPFAVGIGIEVTQLVFSLLLGYPYRVIDINDVIFNALGVSIGYVLFRFFAWLFIITSRSAWKKPAAMSDYIHEVINRV